MPANTADKMKAPTANVAVTRARRPNRDQERIRICGAAFGGSLTGPVTASSDSQLVAHASDGEDELRVGRVRFDLGPQTADMDVDQPPVAEVVVAPHPFEQLLPAQHLARVLGQLAQKPELGAGAVNLHPGAADDPGVGDELHVAEGQCVGAVVDGAGSSQEG